MIGSYTDPNQYSFNRTQSRLLAGREWAERQKPIRSIRSYAVEALRGLGIGLLVLIMFIGIAVV